MHISLAPASVRRFAPHFFVLWLIALWITPNATAQRVNLTLTERVGEVLDREERDYFRLLPEVEEYVEARFVARGDSVDTIVRTSSDTQEFAMSTASFDELRDYVENYEHLYTRGDPIDIVLLNTAFRLVAYRVVNVDESQVVLTTTSGEELGGLVVAADDATRDRPDFSRSGEYFARSASVSRALLWDTPFIGMSPPQ